MLETGIFAGSIFSGMGDDAAPTMTAITQMRTGVPQTIAPTSPLPTQPAPASSTTGQAVQWVAYQWLWIAGGVALVGVAGWFIWRRRKAAAVTANRRRRRR